LEYEGRVLELGIKAGRKELRRRLTGALNENGGSN
jgi:hypothetical protein